MSVQRQATT